MLWQRCQGHRCNNSDWIRREIHCRWCNNVRQCCNSFRSNATRCHRNRCSTNRWAGSEAKQDLGGSTSSVTLGQEGNGTTDYAQGLQRPSVGFNQSPRRTDHNTIRRANGSPQHQLNGSAIGHWPSIRTGHNGCQLWQRCNSQPHVIANGPTARANHRRWLQSNNQPFSWLITGENRRLHRQLATGYTSRLV